MHTSEVSDVNRNSSKGPRPYGRLFLVLLALLCLTAITIMAARLDLGAFKIATALAIAAVKSSLVLYFFMHIRKAGAAVPIAFLVTLVILVVFIGFTFFDVAYR